MENFVNDIQELEQVRHFLIKASTSNNADTINACNGLALEKLNKHIDAMSLNKVNIEFLRKQMDKVLMDIEELKDANREIHYKNGNGAQ